jgi:hypothetical protein
MEKIIDLIATDSAASEISDYIKQSLFTKASERIENIKPLVSTSLFGEDDNEGEETSTDEE